METSFLGLSSDWWNILLVVGLVAAALAAVLVFVAQYGVMQSERKEARASQIDAEHARAETERIKSLVLWRTVPEVDLKILKEKLALGRGHVAIAYVQNDPEALWYAGIISRSFEEATKIRGSDGWGIVLDPRLYSDRLIFGVSIFGKDANAVSIIRLAFEAAHIPYSPEPIPAAPIKIGTMVTWPGEPDVDTIVMIGSKQPPFN